MGRTCTICRHPDRASIEEALVRGEPFRLIAARYGLSPQALRRHKAAHLPPALARAKGVEEIVNASRLLRDLHRLREDAARIAAKAEAADSFAAATGALREQARIIEILLKVAGELAEGTTINVNTGPWIEWRTIVLGALEPFPEAKEALMEALRGA